MPSSFGRFAGAVVLVAGASAACAAVLPKLVLPADSPVALLGADYGDSSETARGGAVVVDLRAALTLRNASKRHIRGITLSVTSQDITAGGRGSVTLASIDAGPGETIPVRIDMRLLRPAQQAGEQSTPVVIGLDGVLFEDLSFYGPDKLNSRRALTVCELEARRDRRYFQNLLAQGGAQRVQNEILALLQRGAAQNGFDVQMVRGGRATNAGAERQMQFAFLNLPDAPVEPLTGSAQVARNEARAPRFEVRNRSDRPIRYLEIAWILRDRQGREFLAGSVPAELNLAPGHSGEILKDTALKFPARPGAPLSIDSMSGFVSSVEFADGKFWVPSRADLAGPGLRATLGPSIEEQRLVQLYRKHGLKAVIDELSSSH